MIRNFTLMLAAILFSNGLISCANLGVSNRSSKPVAAIAYDFSQGQDLTDGASPSNDGWMSLSLREKIGQTMIVVANHHVHVSQFGSIDAMMKQYPIGGVFIPSWIYSSHKPADDVIPNIRRAIADYQQAAKYPLIISEDFERGVGDSYPEYTSMPTEMSVGAANSPELARQYGATIAREAHSLGVNWLLHPVSDLSMNPLNDLILERATSDDPSRAYPLLKAQMAGMHQQGVVSTIKHFPGDGVTMKNQHLVTSTNTLSLQEWHSSFGNLYQKLINDCAPSIKRKKLKGFILRQLYQVKL
jgi:beta-N-acetylhexosaminidase